MKSSTETIIGALRVLAVDIQSSDGVANAAIAEAADRMDELESAERMFMEACADLGEINEALGLDPNDAGAEPIIDAIEKLKSAAAILAQHGTSHDTALLPKEQLTPASAMRKICEEAADKLRAYAEIYTGDKQSCRLADELENIAIIAPNLSIPAPKIDTSARCADGVDVSIGDDATFKRTLLEVAMEYEQIPRFGADPEASYRDARNNLIAYIDSLAIYKPLMAGLAAPDGYKLVPIQPTEGMIVAIEVEVDSQLTASGMCHGDMQRQDGGEIYVAMLAAAPSVSIPVAQKLCLWIDDGPGATSRVERHLYGDVNQVEITGTTGKFGLCTTPLYLSPPAPLPLTAGLAVPDSRLSEPPVLNADELGKVKEAKRVMVDVMIASEMNYGTCGVVSFHLNKLIDSLAVPQVQPSEALALPSSADQSAVLKMATDELRNIANEKVVNFDFDYSAMRRWSESRCRHTLAQIEALAAAEQWQPTAENINALPDGIRRFVHDLSTRCDPAGDVAQNIFLRDQCERLQIMYRKSVDALEDVRGCFRAAEIEGLEKALAETTDDHLKDLVERRLMYALYAAQTPELVEQWVSLDDRLPPADSEVLAIWKAGKLAGNLIQTMVTSTTYILKNLHSFTHWMPLPAAPAGKQGGA